MSQNDISLKGGIIFSMVSTRLVTPLMKRGKFADSVVTVNAPKDALFLLFKAVRTKRFGLISTATRLVCCTSAQGSLTNRLRASHPGPMRRTPGNRSRILCLLDQDQ